MIELRSNPFYCLQYFRQNKTAKKNASDIFSSFFYSTLDCHLTASQEEKHFSSIILTDEPFLFPLSNLHQNSVINWDPIISATNFHLLCSLISVACTPHTFQVPTSSTAIYSSRNASLPKGINHLTCISNQRAQVNDEVNESKLQYTQIKIHRPPCLWLINVSLEAMTCLQIV